MDSNLIPDLSLFAERVSNVSEALRLHELGLSLIPLVQGDTTGGKAAAVPWKPYQEARATEQQVKGWFGNGEARNIGVVTGAVSGIVVIDCDDDAAIAWADRHLPATPWVTKTWQGEHRYFRHPGQSVPNKVALKTDDEAIRVDVRGDGGYVVGPGSVRTKCKKYADDELALGIPVHMKEAWTGDATTLPVFNPDWLPKAARPYTRMSDVDTRRVTAQTPVAERIRRAKAYVSKIPGARVGERDHAMYKVARIAVTDFAVPEEEARAILAEYAQRCEQTADTPDFEARLQSALNHAATGSKLGIQEFVTYKNRIVDDNPDNCRLALRKLSVTLRYNELTDQTLVNGEPFSDATLGHLWLAIQDHFHFKPTKDLLLTVIVDDAQYDTFHPVREYLQSLKWDGTPRLDSWLITHGGAPDNPYVREVSALPLIAAVRRVMHPGAKFDELLVLESEQGYGKSLAIRALCPEESWYTDSLPLAVDAKVVIERTAGIWIAEASELHGFKGKDVEHLKAFLSRQVDGPVRLAYGRLPVSKPRTFISIGTTNSAAYLMDSTGGRRFWPVAITRPFDLKRLEADRDQLWAEAAAREAAGASIRLSPQLYDAAAAEQELRRIEDGWEDLLDTLSTGKDKVSNEGIWSALEVPKGQRTTHLEARVISVMTRLGFVKPKQPIWVDGKTQRGWVRKGQR